MEQLPEAGIVPPDRLSEEPPLVMLTVPPQVFDVGDAAVFFMLVEGYVSVKAVPAMAVVLGLVSVMVMVAAPLISIVPGLKSLTAVGGASAVSEAEAALPGNVLAVVITPVLLV
jgi:hypothetical protein